MLVAHIRALRTLPGFEAANIVFIPENNLGWEAERMESMLGRAGVPRVITVDEDDRRPGVHTTKELKKQMAVLFNRALMDRRVLFHERLVTVDEDHSAAEMRKLVQSELKTYQRILEPSKNDPLADPKERFSGKMGGGCDDHALAVQINYVGRNLFYNRREKYGQYH